MQAGVEGGGGGVGYSCQLDQGIVGEWAEMSWWRLGGDMMLRLRGGRGVKEGSRNLGQAGPATGQEVEGGGGCSVHACLEGKAVP